VIPRRSGFSAKRVNKITNAVDALGNLEDISVPKKLVKKE
jgi:hypothetical protein